MQVGFSENEWGSCGVLLEGVLFKLMPEGHQSAPKDRSQTGRQKLSYYYNACQAFKASINAVKGRSKEKIVIILSIFYILEILIIADRFYQLKNS